VSLDESTDALARVSHRFPVLADGHIARGYAIVDGPSGHPDLPTFRLSRFAEGKPIRVTYGDWLMC